MPKIYTCLNCHKKIKTRYYCSIECNREKGGYIPTQSEMSLSKNQPLPILPEIDNMILPLAFLLSLCSKKKIDVSDNEEQESIKIEEIYD